MSDSAGPQPGLWVQWWVVRADRSFYCLCALNLRCTGYLSLSYRLNGPALNIFQSVRIDVNVSVRCTNIGMAHQLRQLAVGHAT